MRTFKSKSVIFNSVEEMLFLTLVLFREYKMYILFLVLIFMSVVRNKDTEV